ncbi:MAG TPA: hypothetical protein VJU86_02335 [Pyrinomonadaceae bacterium]|nr:hypothetical protein [Pyrinomonadaceae bacterium]
MRILPILFMTSVALSPSDAGAVHQDQGRIRPPVQLQCDRSDLTSYDGKITAYRRRYGSTFLRIRTNFDTTEEVTIRHPRTDNPLKFFLLNGEAFTNADWSRIEQRPKVLKEGMHANVWVCRDNPKIQPVVDWRPDDTGANPRSR